jgi:hypothetical protein
MYKLPSLTVSKVMKVMLFLKMKGLIKSIEKKRQEFYENWRNYGF